MRVFRSLEEVRAAENLEPCWRLAPERVMGDLTSAYAGAGLTYDPDTEGPVVLAEQGDTGAVPGLAEGERKEARWKELAASNTERWNVLLAEHLYRDMPNLHFKHNHSLTFRIVGGSLARCAESFPASMPENDIPLPHATRQGIYQESVVTPRNGNTRIRCLRPCQPFGRVSRNEWPFYAIFTDCVWPFS